MVKIDTPRNKFKSTYYEGGNDKSDEHGEWSVKLHFKTFEDYSAFLSYWNGANGVLKEGETRRFLDRCHLDVGMIKHNINNMWWVLKDNGEVRNIAEFDIFEIVDSGAD